MSDSINPLLARAYDLKGKDDVLALYEEWAETYDSDTLDQFGYVGPAIAAEALAELIVDGDLVLDAGCGTGLVGREVASRTAAVIDGIDLTPHMLRKAEATGVYRNLTAADLTQTLDIADGTYDAAICVGTLTDGHVGPEAIDELVRVVKADGHLVASITSLVWETHGYRSRVDELVEAGTVTVRSLDERPYHVKEDLTCRLVVLRVA